MPPLSSFIATPKGSVSAFLFDGAPKALPGLKPSLAIIWKPLEVGGRDVARALSRAEAVAAARPEVVLARDFASDFQ